MHPSAQSCLQDVKPPVLGRLSTCLLLPGCRLITCHSHASPAVLLDSTALLQVWLGAFEFALQQANQAEAAATAAAADANDEAGPSTSAAATTGSAAAAAAAAAPGWSWSGP